MKIIFTKPYSVWAEGEEATLKPDTATRLVRELKVAEFVEEAKEETKEIKKYSKKVIGKAPKTKEL